MQNQQYSFLHKTLFYSVKSNDGLVTFGVYFGILKPKHAHCKEQRGRRRDNETDSLGATSIDKIGEVRLSDEILLSIEDLVSSTLWKVI